MAVPEFGAVRDVFLRPRISDDCSLAFRGPTTMP